MDSGHDESKCRFGHVWFPADLTQLEQDIVTGIHQGVNRLLDRARAAGVAVTVWTVDGGHSAMVALPGDHDTSRFSHVTDFAQTGRTVCPHDCFSVAPPVPHPDGSALLRIQSDTARAMRGKFGHVGLSHQRKNGVERLLMMEAWAPVPDLTPVAASALAELLKSRPATTVDELLEAGLVAAAATADAA